MGDTAANVGALLDALQTLTAAGALQSIVFTDFAPPTLSLTAAQLTADAATLARIDYDQNAYVYVSNVAANGIPVGSDASGSGTAGSPFATIARAEAALQPGQTILLNGVSASPAAYTAATMSIANTAIDCVQAYGARIVAAAGASAVLYLDPVAGGTITVGKVVIDAADTVQTAVALAASAAGPYAAIFNGTHIENFTGFGVLGEAANVSARRSSADLGSQDGATAAIYFDHMASGGLDVELTSFNIKQALTGYGAAVTAYAVAAGPSVQVRNSTLTVTSVAGTSAGDAHYGIRLINVRGAIIEGNKVSVDSSASPGWGSKPISISTTLDATALDSGNFVIAGNTVYAATNASSGIAIQIGEEDDQPSTRGKLNGGVIWGNTVTSSPSAQLAGTHGIFVGSQANTIVYGNKVSGLGIGIVDKNGDGAIYYANSVSNCASSNILLKGSLNATVVDNNIFTGAAPYDVFGIVAESNPATGDSTSGSIVAGNWVVASGAGAPHFVQLALGQSVDFSNNTYVSAAPLDFASWQWNGLDEGSYPAWQAASQERGGAYSQGSSIGGTLNAYAVPVNGIAPLTPAQKLSAYGLDIGAVGAGDAPRVAALPGVTGVRVVDTAAAVDSDLNSLEAVAMMGELTSIAFTDTTTPTLRVDAQTLVADAAVVAAIAGPYDLSVGGSLAALQAVTLAPSTLAHLAGGLTVADTVADVTAMLDRLQVLASAGQLAAIDLTDPGNANSGDHLWPNCTGRRRPAADRRRA